MLGVMVSPDALDTQLTLRTAVARFDELRTRHSLAESTDLGDEPGMGEPALSKTEVLEMLALGEVIARKAGYGRQLGVRSARTAGASWSEIGQALSTSKQSAWESHTRWIDQQAAHHRDDVHEGFTDVEAHRARAEAGSPDQ